MKKLFVYGTLMRGQRAEDKLTGATYLGDYELKNYAMYNLGRYPGIIPADGETVYGELYEISEDMIQRLDEYEEEGSLYHRIETAVTNDAGAEAAIVYVYAQEVSGEPMRCRWGTI